MAVAASVNVQGRGSDLRLTGYQVRGRRKHKGSQISPRLGFLNPTNWP